MEGVARAVLMGIAIFLLIPPWGFSTYFYTIKIVQEYERA